MQDNPEYISPSRNESPYRVDAATCHHCREPFKPGQTRFVILDSTDNGWERVSICMDDFKYMRPPYIDSSDHGLKHQRFRRTCRGCGEPISISSHPRFQYEVCSRRCYQRYYRKHRREHGSMIDWKHHDWPSCEVCDQEIRGRRKDVKFCSSACRQWAYRQRNR